MTGNDHEERNPYAAPGSEVTVTSAETHRRRFPVLLFVGDVAYGIFDAVLFNGGSGDRRVSYLFAIVLVWLIVGTIIGARNNAWLPAVAFSAAILQLTVIGVGIATWGMISWDGAMIVGIIVAIMIAIGVYHLLVA